VLASILGVRRADPESRTSAAVAARLRLENNGPSHVTFDPNSLELVTGTLQPLPPPQVQPPTTLDLAPGQRQEVTAYFPLPPGADPNRMNLNNLRLRWQVRIDNYTVPQSALFERRTSASNSDYESYAPSPSYGPDVAY
jgi:hypothetical protein